MIQWDLGVYPWSGLMTLSPAAETFAAPLSELKGFPGPWSPIY